MIHFYISFGWDGFGKYPTSLCSCFMLIKLWDELIRFTYPNLIKNKTLLKTVSRSHLSFIRTSWVWVWRDLGFNRSSDFPLLIEGFECSRLTYSNPWTSIFISSSWLRKLCCFLWIVKQVAAVETDSQQPFKPLSVSVCVWVCVRSKPGIPSGN